MGENNGVELPDDHPFKRYLDNYEYFQNDSQGFFYLNYRMHPLIIGLLGTSGAISLIISAFLSTPDNDIFLVYELLKLSFALYVLSFSIPCFFKTYYYLHVENNFITYKKKNYPILDIKEIIVTKKDLIILFQTTQRIEIPYQTINVRDMKLFLATLVKINPDVKHFLKYDRTF